MFAKLSRLWGYQYSLQARDFLFLRRFLAKAYPSICWPGNDCTTRTTSRLPFKDLRRVRPHDQLYGVLQSASTPQMFFIDMKAFSLRHCELHLNPVLNLALERGLLAFGIERERMGRGKGKGKRGGRGGGGRQHFVSSLEELEARNVRDDAWNARRKAEREADDDDDSEENQEQSKGTREMARNDDNSYEDGEDDSGEEEGDDKDGERKAVEAMRRAVPSMELEKKPKSKGVSGLIDVENPNAKPKATRLMKAKDMDMSAAPVELSRREREQIEAERKKEHYQKLHAQGKTQEAQVDMARLAIVRKRREEAGKKTTEEAAAAEAEKEKMEKAIKTGTGSKIQKLNPLEVKKMNPTRLKELLKERDQSLHGNKKDLISRLLEWEKANNA